MLSKTGLRRSKYAVDKLIKLMVDITYDSVKFNKFNNTGHLLNLIKMGKLPSF